MLEYEDEVFNKTKTTGLEYLTTELGVRFCEVLISERKNNFDVLNLFRDKFQFNENVCVDAKIAIEIVRARHMNNLR